MKTYILVLILGLCPFIARSQLVATLELNEPVEGLCNTSLVYVLSGILIGQQEAVCPASNSEIIILLNSGVEFLKQNPSFSGKCQVNILINCRGEMVRITMDRSTNKNELDEQILKVFGNLGVWEAGRLNGIEVDSIITMSLKIRKGQITFG